MTHEFKWLHDAPIQILRGIINGSPLIAKNELEFYSSLELDKGDDLVLGKDVSTGVGKPMKFQGVLKCPNIEVLKKREGRCGFKYHYTIKYN